MLTGEVSGAIGLPEAAYSEGTFKNQRLWEIWRNGFQRYREPILAKHNPLTG
ncbi:hypothetical protein [Candidatus Methylomirabilis limnetica]|uniref:hypothetical protein n=1 Tax=Candidatus Methylomirabilis limnetica TaxID=2033718 RepID=UPI00137B2518|nr:hypothetical protein [Candidatus Methylomirabilis limnetica]